VKKRNEFRAPNIEMTAEHKCSHAHCGCGPRHVVISVDYEIFGNGEGDVRQHTVDPTNRMARLCEKYGAPLTVFFEVEEYLAFEKISRRAGGETWL